MCVVPLLKKLLVGEKDIDLKVCKCMIIISHDVHVQWTCNV